MGMTVSFVRCISLTLIFTITWLHIFSAPCNEDFCATLQCKNMSSSCDLVIENATKCGCCPICIKYMMEKSQCYPLSIKDIGISTDHCGPQLVCVKNVCKRKITTCLEELTAYEQESDLGYLQIAKTKPHCDDDGEYFRKQCRPGSWCFCVDKEGKRIFGESNNHANDRIDCACSRMFHDMKNVTANSPMNNWYTSFNFLDNFFRCLPTGDFDVMQCVGDKCFCINKNDLSMDSNRIVSKEMFRDLHCYDPSYHSEQLLRECERELQNTRSYHERELKQNKTVVGLDVPNCDLDGSYAPKQCRENNCYCADKEGNKIENYQVSRYSDAAEEMKCECARENLFLKKNGLSKQVACSPTGDYEPKQCLGGFCYCVDKDGEQMGREFDRDSSTDCP